MKKLLALVLALVMTLSLCVTSNAAYSDAADVDYKEAVDVMSAVGVFQGADGKFSPKAELTREQAAKLIAYLDLGEKVAEALPAVKAFNDVEANRWSAKYVAYCADAGYLAGVGNGNFDPAGKLTGYAFGKMLLCALGYDAKIEGFTGANWQIAVAKLMQSNDIAKSVDASASTTLTREAAAQYCLNTLKATMVEYDSKGANIAVNGATIDFGASKAKAKTWVATEGKNYTTGAASAAGETVQLCEKLFPKLYQSAANSGLAAANGRNGYEWKLSDKTDAISDFIVVDEAVLATSTNGTSISDLTTYSTTNSKFVKKVNWTTAGTTYKVFVNGKEVTAYTGTPAATAGVYNFDTTNLKVTLGDGTAANDINGNGVKIEFVDTNEQTEFAEKIYVTTYRIDVVAKAPVVKTNTATGKEMVYVDMGTDIGNVDPANVNAVKAADVKGYEGLAKDDVVSVIAMADGTYTITKLEPTVAQATAVSGTTLTIDGTAVKAAKNVGAHWNDQGFYKDVKFYYDEYGYGVYAKAVEATSTDYLMVLENAAYSDTTFTSTTNKSLVVFADGKTETIVVNSNAGNKFADKNMTVPTTGEIYSYTKNDDGTYALVAAKGNSFIKNATDAAVTTKYGTANANLFAATTNNADGAITKGQSAVGGTVTGTALKANADTVYVVRDLKAGAHANAYTDADYKSTWTATTGFAAAKGVTNAAMSAFVGSDGYADIIFVYYYVATAVTSDTTDYAYITSTTATTYYKADGTTVDYKAYDAIVDGVKTVVKTASSVTIANVGLYIVDYTDGKIAASVDATLVSASSFGATDYRYAKVTSLAKPEGGMVVAGGTSYSYAEGCKVFEINSVGAVTELDIEGYDAIASAGNIWLVNNNEKGSSTATADINTITEIYIQK